MGQFLSKIFNWADYTIVMGYLQVEVEFIMANHEENHEHRFGRESVNTEVLALRQKFDEFKSSVSADWYQTLIDDYFAEMGVVAGQGDYFKRRALEEMLILRFGIHLAERFSPIDHLTWPWRMGVDDDAENIVATSEEIEGHLLVALSISAIMNPIPSWFSGVSSIERENSLVTDTEFIELVCGGWEEYAHILFESVKSEEDRDIDYSYRRELSGVFQQFPDISDEESDVLYHTITSEYRGLIWKSKFVRTYIPSLADDMKQLTARVEAKRKDLREKGIY